MVRDTAPWFATARIEQASTQVEEAFDDARTVEQVAAPAGPSPSRFTHLFRDPAGDASAEYLARLRLERAAMHVVQSGRLVTEVALAVGHASHAGFTHAFAVRFVGSATTFRTRRARRPFRRGRVRANRNFHRPNRPPLRVSDVPRKVSIV